MADLAKAVSMATAKGGGGAVTIEDVFSTYLYEGNGSTQSIVNGINLADDGGMVWTKCRDLSSTSNVVVDTERTFGYALFSDLTSGETNYTPYFTGVNSDGYSITETSTRINNVLYDYVSWTFKKAPRFFDVVTWSGNGTNRTISHNLGSVPGMIIVKCVTNLSEWHVYHTSLGATKEIRLSSNISAQDENNYYWNATEPTDSVFSLGITNSLNGSGREYIAYLFADDPLGPSGDGSDGLIKCGSYTGNGSADGPEIDLGWEPQYILVKSSTRAEHWFIFDTMRGLVVGGSDQRLRPNTSDAEGSEVAFDITPTGFKLTTVSGDFNANGAGYIYMAIRRPMKTPESSDEVFAIDTKYSNSTLPTWQSTFSVDMAFRNAVDATGNTWLTARLIQGNELETNTTDAEASAPSGTAFDYMNGFGSFTSADADHYSWMWKRAAGFFDVVCYEGDGVAGREVSHNLGVVPEMMWVKSRSNAYDWSVYVSGLGSPSTTLKLNYSNASQTGDSTFNDTAPTDSVFSLNSFSSVNGSSNTYIALLFATLAGISKVGFYTGNGASQTIDCSFSGGSKFILIKRTDSTGSWWMYDSVRGIVSGNDPVLQLNDTAAEITTADCVDPDNSGFGVVQESTCNINVNSAEYIYYSISA